MRRDSLRCMSQSANQLLLRLLAVQVVQFQDDLGLSGTLRCGRRRGGPPPNSPPATTEGSALHPGEHPQGRALSYWCRHGCRSRTREVRQGCGKLAGGQHGVHPGAVRGHGGEPQRHLVAEASADTFADIYLGTSPGYRKPMPGGRGKTRSTRSRSPTTKPANPADWLDGSLLRPKGDVTGLRCLPGDMPRSMRSLIPQQKRMPARNQTPIHWNNCRLPYGINSRTLDQNVVGHGCTSTSRYIAAEVRRSASDGSAGCRDV